MIIVYSFTWMPESTVVVSFPPNGEGAAPEPRVLQDPAPGQEDGDHDQRRDGQGPSRPEAGTKESGSEKMGEPPLTVKAAPRAVDIMPSVTTKGGRRSPGTSPFTTPIRKPQARPARRVSPTGRPRPFRAAP